MKPAGGGEPKGALAEAIKTPSGAATPRSRKPSSKSAVGNFGSGWTWLVKKADGSVDIVNMGAAGTPLTTADKALLTIDVWEHAYYIDYRNLRPKWVETFLGSLVNWDFAARTSPERSAPVAGARGPLPRRLDGRAVSVAERRAAQLRAGLDAALGEPALVHLQHEAHRLGRAVAVERLRLHVLDVDDAAVVGDEGDRQRQQRVPHPEALLAGCSNDEQHAVVGGHRRCGTSGRWRAARACARPRPG